VGNACSELADAGELLSLLKLVFQGSIAGIAVALPARS